MTTTFPYCQCEHSHEDHPAAPDQWSGVCLKCSCEKYVAHDGKMPELRMVRIGPSAVERVLGFFGLLVKE